METNIPLRGVVLFIAFGTMVFIMVFCFVKRQITRFTLRSSRGPHAVIGHNAPKALSAEIDRRLRRIKDIVHEPLLVHPELEEKLLNAAASDPCHFVYRMKAVDSMTQLDEEFRRCRPSVIKNTSMPLKTFLLDQRLNGPLEGCKLELIDKFSSSYDHARHDCKDFTQAHYQQFMDLLNHLIEQIRDRRREEDNGIRRVLDWEVAGTRPKGTPNLTWEAVVKRDMKKNDMKEEGYVDKKRWRRGVGMFDETRLPQ